ncbi:tyrosine-protein kinase receptor torso-like [Cylas formicarius]|uniref:tyrosine-protein kinase receptor torso-like n=1 Tax=Cylas formicarius TaxID=197179 RepID=UPI00295884BB|nr:tyrosine-protein kinase receptor torso-like [Cylas formicarius]
MCCVYSTLGTILGNWTTMCLDCLNVTDISADHSCELQRCVSTKSCRHQIDLTSTEIRNGAHSPEILCQDEQYLIVAFNHTEHTLYFIEYRTHNGNMTHVSNFSLCGHILVQKLEPHTRYVLYLWAVSLRDGIVTRSRIVESPKRIPNTKISPVNKLVLKSLSLENKIYTATISWEPGAGLSCYYEVLWYKKSQPGLYRQAKINLRVQYFKEYNITKLELGKKYRVSLMATNENRTKESEKKWIQINIPSCVDTYRNLNDCTPPVPNNLTLTKSANIASSNDSIYDITLTWNKPKLLPSYYTASFTNIPNAQANSTTIVVNVSGVHNFANFQNVILGHYFRTKLVAWSQAGSSPPAVLYNSTRFIPETGEHFQTLEPNYWRWIPPILGSVTAVFVVWRIIQRRTRLNSMDYLKIGNAKLTFVANKNVSNKYQTANYTSMESHDSKWEIEERKLLLESITGVGAFGIVQKGYYNLQSDKRLEVAVKMLKAKSTEDQVKQFYDEIEIMKTVPKHQHIVYLIGVITKNRYQNPLMLVEYCSKGDLQSFLRKVWIALGEKDHDNKTDDELEPKMFSNKFYEIESSIFEDDLSLKSKDLLSFARQIAIGMEFLASLKIIHRDLAARNILITKDNVLKISDFGLSRDVYTNNMYQKTTAGKLPIRWMALESLTHQMYTTESDIWSFGIVVWEIVTLGGHPYPTINSEDLIHRLRGGFRMERPLNCDEQVYGLMLKCWDAVPKQRPPFEELVGIFDKLLENEMQYINLEDAKKLDIKYYQNVGKGEIGNNKYEFKGQCIRYVQSTQNKIV